MPSTLAKITIGATSIAGITGGAVASCYYLTAPTDIQGLLKKEGLTLLDVIGEKNKVTWGKLVTKHLGSDSDVTNKKISDLQLTNPTSPPNDNSVNIKAMQKKCKELFETPISSGAAFDTKKQNAIDWCTSESNFAKP